MDEQKHTPTPWKLAEDNRAAEFIQSATGIDLGRIIGSGITNLEDAENARRIVACVNFCAGFSNEQLEAMMSLKAVNDRLTAEDHKILQAMDEIYYLDWREDDDDEETAGWRHPGYFLEVGQSYDFEKLVGAGLAERHSNPDYLAYRISPLGAATVKK